jgi:acetyl-CoA C-acetyltransferase
MQVHECLSICFYIDCLCELSKSGISALLTESTAGWLTGVVKMAQAVIVDAVRSARGRASEKGALINVPSVELLAQQLRALDCHHSQASAQVAGAVIGCVTQAAGQGGNIARPALLAACWPDRVHGMTVTSYCTSGLSALRIAASQAMAENGLMLAGGVEMMSRVPVGADKGLLTHDLGLQKAQGLLPVGMAADLVASIEGFNREACDAYALASQQRAVLAQKEGRNRSRLAVKDEQGELVLLADETPRPQTTAQSLAERAPVFAEMGHSTGLDAWLCHRYRLGAINHVHHAGNSPVMADGASAVLVASADAAKRLDLPVRARILAFSEVAVDRTLALTGAVEATRGVLRKAGLTVDDIDLFEVNEAFAALMLHYMKHLGVPHERLNVNGGAIALGHPMGSTGTALISVALDELERTGGKRAVVAACGAAGLASAVLIERD